MHPLLNDCCYLHVYYLFIVASRIKRKYRIGRMQFESKLADVGMSTYCTFISAVR